MCEMKSGRGIVTGIRTNIGDFSFISEQRNGLKHKLIISLVDSVLDLFIWDTVVIIIL